MLTDKIASTHLGKKSEGSFNYNPSLLVAVPREENRRQYDINSNNLPFLGGDVWHAYEFSCLTESGLPVTRVLKLCYSCTSKFIVESKSLKLYLNSFNMTKLGKTASECLEICKKMIEKDLSEKLETDVTINFLDYSADRAEIFKDFRDIMDYVDENSIEIKNFKESPEVLVIENSRNRQEYRMMFDSLRSNCRVTHQPDFGDVFIYYDSKKHIKEDSLVKYLVSFRSEYHFHEECVEMIFKRLSDLLDKDDSLMVCALYTRIGGIDISPYRMINCSLEDITKLIDLNSFARFGIKQ
jgi:7-cyano-7-deazaguanine reductase